MSAQAGRADPVKDLARCVQHQLTELGEDIGQIDGIIGPRSRRAAAKVQQEHRLRALIRSVPPLDSFTSVTWCRELSRLSAQLGRFRPALTKPYIATNPDLGPEPARVLENAAVRAKQHFRLKYGIRLVSRVDFAGAANAEDLWVQARSLPSHTAPRLVALKEVSEQACGKRNGMAGWAFRSAIFVCWPSNGSHNAVWATIMEKRLGRLMIHEMMHLVQRELANEVVPRRQRTKAWANLGPEWLIEGAAVLVADRFQQPSSASPASEMMARHKNLRRNDLSVAELRTYRSVVLKRGYGLSALATQVLADRFGTAALFDYWRAIGRTGSVEGAFQSTFGMSLTEYERFFDGNRGNFFSLRRFVKTGEL